MRLAQPPVTLSVHNFGLRTFFCLNYIHKAARKTILRFCCNLFQVCHFAILDSLDYKFYTHAFIQIQCHAIGQLFPLSKLKWCCTLIFLGGQLIRLNQHNDSLSKQIITTQNTSCWWLKSISGRSLSLGVNVNGQWPPRTTFSRVKLIL